MPDDKEEISTTLLLMQEQQAATQKQLAALAETNSSLRDENTELRKKMEGDRITALSNEQGIQGYLEAARKRHNPGKYLWSVSYDFRKPWEVRKDVQYNQRTFNVTTDVKDEQLAINEYFRRTGHQRTDGESVSVKAEFIGENPDYVPKKDRVQRVKPYVPSDKEVAMMRRTGKFSASAFRANKSKVNS